MSHLDYYQYQAQARGIRDADDVRRQARELGYRYEHMLGGWLPADRQAPLADLACGHGSFLAWLSERGHRNLRGVDAAPEQVRLARTVGATVDEADVLVWLERQAPESFQVLFAIDFIEHISKDDCLRLLALARRALAPGGRLILRYPNGDSPLVGLNLFNDITHVWTYTSNCLTSLAAMQGYGRCEFADEGVQAIRDRRWLKVPLGRLASWILGALLQAASRERVRYWNSSLWACLHR